MCGIVGSINHKLVLSDINKVMGHRGPDERNVFKKDNVEFYHLRLSIQGIIGGVQPMHFLDRYTLIFNGEIYNHQTLRTRYQLNCQTSSDTETILHLYHKLGLKCFLEMDGMFALAILDRQKRKLLLVRDRAGKKPLYIYKKESKLLFASELNCLNTLLNLDIEEQHIAQFLRLGYFYKTNTPYKNVTEVEAGSYVEIDVDSLESKQNKWWNINNYYQQNSLDSFTTALDKIDTYLHQGVKRRVESSDLEVGSFLSGGIDSGLVTAIASKYSPKRLKTFTVSFDGEYNEAPLAKLVSDKYQTNHSEIKITFDNLKNDIEYILGNYGEPFFDSSAIPSYYVCQAAKKHLTVVLNGDGADELFAGYRRYVPFSKYDFFSTPNILRNGFQILNQIIPPSHNKKSKYNFFYRLTDFARKSGLDAYLSATTDILPNNLILGGDKQYISEVKKSLQSIINQSSLSGLNKIMNIDFNYLLAGDLLVKMDIATMANSLEGRSPFLCKEILQYAPTIKDSYKIKGTRTKHILRELSIKYLPETLLNQPKRGFEIPLKEWVENDLKDVILDYLGSSNAYYKNFIPSHFTDSLLKNTLKVSKEKRAKIIWLLFTLEVWYQRVYKCA